MKYGRYGWSYRWLTWGLGATFLWIGIDIWLNPQNWIGFVPASLPTGLSRETALQANGAVDILLGLAFLMQWWPRITGLVSAGHLVAVIALQGIDAVLIRDVGLLGASLAVVSWPHGYKKHHRWMFWRKRHSTDAE